MTTQGNRAPAERWRKSIERRFRGACRLAVAAALISCVMRHSMTSVRARELTAQRRAPSHSALHSLPWRASAVVSGNARGVSRSARARGRFAILHNVKETKMSSQSVPFELIYRAARKSVRPHFDGTRWTVRTRVAGRSITRHHRQREIAVQAAALAVAIIKTRTN